MIEDFPRRWDKKTRIDFLQRKIIINSILYYELNTSLMSDRDFDELSRQLVELQADYNVRETQYGYMMYDFDGTTGFDLYNRLNEHDKDYLLHIARHLIRHQEKPQEKPQQKKPKKRGALF